MAKVEIEVPDYLTPEEQAALKGTLEDMFRTKWELFKRNAQAFFDSLRDLLGYLWNKIANWARDLWYKIFG